MKSTFLLIILVPVFSCFLKGNGIYISKKSYKDKDTLRCIVSEREIRNKIFLDTVIIFVCPTERELDSLHKANGNEWYETLEQDAGMYNTDALTFLLNKPRTNKYLITDSVDLFIFVYKNDPMPYGVKKSFFVNEYNSPWLIILFNGIDKPVVTAPVNIVETYNNYFKKKKK